MNLIDILIIAAMVAVVITLGFGMHALYKGGDEGRTRSNKLMRMRVVLQAVAIVLLVIGMAIKAGQGA